MLVGFVGGGCQKYGFKAGGAAKKIRCVKERGGGSPTSSIAKVLTLMQRHLFAF